MRRIIVGLSLSVLVTACAAPAPPTLIWEKPAATIQDLRADKYQCLQDAASKAPTTAGTYGRFSGDANGVSGHLTSQDMNSGLRQQLFGGCMGVKGWHLLNATQMSNELKQADQICNASSFDDADKAVEVSECAERIERPIWQKYEPSTLGLYDSSRAKMTELATQLHHGDMSHDEYIEAVKKVRADLVTNLAKKRNLTE